MLGFLLYSPLNQGLKQTVTGDIIRFYDGFLLYSPLNQGLKQLFRYLSPIILKVFTLQSIKSRIETLMVPHNARAFLRFLLYSPLNQGLKPRKFPHSDQKVSIVFTLQSIKSRIETTILLFSRNTSALFLLYSPLNQGLKLNVPADDVINPNGFYSTVH